MAEDLDPFLLPSLLLVYLSLAQEMVLPQAEPALRAPCGMGQDSEIRVTREETACVFSNAHVKGGTRCPKVARVQKAIRQNH